MLLLTGKVVSAASERVPRNIGSHDFVCLGAIRAGRHANRVIHLS